MESNPWQHRTPSGVGACPGGMIMKREELARELLENCPAAWQADYCKIADALKQGQSVTDILNMAEVHRLPGTYAWLAERL
jgi:hypothetical protein